MFRKENIRSFIDKNAFRLVVLCVLIYVVYFSWASIWRYSHFDFESFDLAIGNQVLWNILHGSMECSIRGGNFLGDHFRPIYYLYLPFYMLFPDPRNILVLQSIVLACGAFPVFLIGSLRCGRIFGLLFAGMYLFNPIVGYINLFEFHPEVAVAPLLLFAIYFFYKNQFKAFMCFIVLALCCKENVSFIVFLFGFWVIAAKKSVKWYLGTFLLSAAWFLISFKIIIPFFNKGNYSYFLLYDYLGSSFTEMVRTMVTQPLTVIKVLTLFPNLKYLSNVFIQFGYLSLFSPFVLLPALPIFLQIMLSFARGVPQIYTHYNALLLPFLFTGMIITVDKIVRLTGGAEPHGKRTYVKKILTVYLISIALFTNWYYGPHMNLPKKHALFDDDDMVIVRNKIVSNIPAGAECVATFDLLPVLSSREGLYSFHYIYWGFDQLTQKQFVLPDKVMYAAINFDDTNIFWATFSPVGDSNMRRFFDDGKWKVIEGANSCFLFRKQARSGDYLYSVVNEPSIQYPLIVQLNPRIICMGFDINSTAVIPGNVLTFKTYLGQNNPHLAGAKVVENVNYGMYTQLVDREGTVVLEYKRPICYGVYPNIKWKTDEVVRELNMLYVPLEVPPGTYALKIGTYKSKVISDAMPVKKNIDEVIVKYPPVELTIINVLPKKDNK